MVELDFRSNGHSLRRRLAISSKRVANDRKAEALSATELTDLVLVDVEKTVSLWALEKARTRSERERQQLVAKAERLR